MTVNVVQVIFGRHLVSYPVCFDVKPFDSYSMDHRAGFVPQLSNEMQLSLMNMVKSGELSIDEALIRAKSCKHHFQRSCPVEEKQPSQYNFSVRKFNRYIWQKRVLQVDFSKSQLCSIEKGIVKRQLLFSDVKNCHDAAGTRFSISFKGRPDYELEAASAEDKQKIIQLLNRIIYSNIYSLPVDRCVETEPPNAPPGRLNEGHILLQRGGLASFKWKRYEAHLETGLLTLLPVAQQPVAVDTESSVDEHRCAEDDRTAVVIHLSDVRVETPGPPHTFTLINHKNDFLFKVPRSEHMSSEAVRSERDAWVKAIKELCIDWSRRSQHDNFYDSPERNHSDITESRGEPEHTTQNNHLPGSPPPVPPSVRPRLPKTPSSGPEAALTDPEPRSLERSEPELKPDPRAQQQHVPTAEERPSAVPETSTYTLLSPVLPVAPVSFIPMPPAPLPPPPPPMKTSKQLSDRTRAFHWDLVPQDKIERSMWGRRSWKRIEIDTSRLYELFRVRESDACGKSEGHSNVEIMLNAKIAHNFNIFLKSFPVSPKELKDKLLIINEEDGGLSDEHIASLRRYVPTADDIEMYKSHKGDVTELHVVDQYMLEMCHIPNLSAQLDLLLVLRELPICMEDLTPLISQKIRMCQQLLSCESFFSVLEYLLTMGNYLNQSAGKDRARGFRLSSLSKLSQMRGNNRRFTLLHALMEQIMQREPSLASFFLELTEFETVSGASVKGLTAEVDVVKNEFQKVVQYRKAHKRKNTANQPKFFKDLKTAIERYDTDLSQLMKRCEDMRKLYTDILVKFGEPMDQDSQELFGWICQFINEFKKVYTEIVQ